jgi:hypothetical protein
MLEVLWHNLGHHRFALDGGGDQGELDKSSTHMKSLLASRSLWETEGTCMVGDSKMIRMEEGEGSKRADNKNKQNMQETTMSTDGASVEDRKDWAMKIYQGKRANAKEEEDEVGMLELDLDEEEPELSSNYLAIVVFYSRKRYNPHYLFLDMMAAWGVPKMAVVEKMEDYTFKLEFAKEEEKIKVLQGGPLRHKGDALIVVHYDGMMSITLMYENVPHLCFTCGRMGHVVMMLVRTPGTSNSGRS